MVSEFTPVSQRGAMLAINNAVATSAGLIGPQVMGSVVQEAIKARTSAVDGYMHGFMICGVMALGCRLIGMLFLRPQHEAARLAESQRPLAVAAEYPLRNFFAISSSRSSSSSLASSPAHRANSGDAKRAFSLSAE
jgi:MFS family permease